MSIVEEKAKGTRGCLCQLCTTGYGSGGPVLGIGGGELPTTPSGDWFERPTDEQIAEALLRVAKGNPVLRGNLRKALGIG